MDKPKRNILPYPFKLNLIVSTVISISPLIHFRSADGLIHFLDIKVLVGGTDIYRIQTHTRQYTYFSSFEPFLRKTA